MCKVKMLLFFGAIFIALLFIAVVLFFMLRPKVAGIYVEASPNSSVTINGEVVGTTPYRDVKEPGEVILKISNPENKTLSYETRVTLLPGVETVVRYAFGNSDEASSGEIISFEKIAKGETSLAVVSIPDSAEITIDGGVRVHAPHKTSAIEEGDHTLLLKAAGYEDKTVRVKTHKGYKLTAIVTLAKLPAGVKANATPTPAVQKPLGFVFISGVGIDFVRVRETPATSGREVGRVALGKSYPFLEQDITGNWFKIEYETGVTGWISSQFARRMGVDGVIDTPTPLPTRAPVTNPTSVITPSVTPATTL
jgi:hypothetical protein